jgi:hypothetical protein
MPHATAVLAALFSMRITNRSAPKPASAGSSPRRRSSLLRPNFAVAAVDNAKIIFGRGNGRSGRDQREAALTKAAVNSDT